MNIIKGFPDNVGQPPVSQVINIANKSREIRQNDPNKAGNSDQVDMSMLSQLMAKSSRELAAEMQPRPDVVSKVKHDDAQVEMSAHVVDTIFRHMLGG